MQKSVLEEFPDTDISVSLVWIDMLPTDNAAASSKIAATIDNARVRHFHDPRAGKLAGKAFAHELIKVGPAWDIYLFYEKGTAWDGEHPPSPAEWWHQLGGKDRADPKRFSAGVLEDRLHESMHKVTGAQCSDK